MIAVSNVCWRSFGTFNRTSSLGLQVALVMAGSGVAAGLTAFIALRIAQPVRFGIQKRVQRLLHRAPDHPIQVILDPLVVDRDDIAQRTRCILSHGGSFLLYWLRFSHLQFSQIRGRQSYLIVRKKPYVIPKSQSLAEKAGRPKMG